MTNDFNSPWTLSVRGFFSIISLLWEIPLSFFSFFFYKLNRYLISRLYRRFLSSSVKRSTTWRLLDRNTLLMPISLPVLMTTGPRWNTHALIGTLGPLKVSRSVSLCTSMCMNSASSWTGVIYRFPDFHTVSQFSSLSDPASQDWSSIALPPGRYVLGIRYYGLSATPQMPHVCVDDSFMIDGVNTPLETNQVYADLIDRSGFYYHCLHYYIFNLLRFRSLFSPSFVRREFLPVGDPDTLFCYGIIQKRHCLQVSLNAELFAGYRVFLTVYNRASLPFLSIELNSEHWQSGSLPFDGFYLFRIRPLKLGLPSVGPDDVQVSLK